MTTTPKPRGTTARHPADEPMEVMLAKHARIRDMGKPTGISLTWSEAEAGKACRGCRLEVMGDARWRGRIPAERRAEYTRINEADGSSPKVSKTLRSPASDCSDT
ncbi:MAG TPA: hypothetical protein VFC16_10590 [Nakamurella sp.]|nr:hypothetical protein [Nakamurella sp.]